MITDLEAYEITYLPLHIARPRIQNIFPKGVKGAIYRRLPNGLMRKHIKNVLFNNDRVFNRIVLSEENILGTSINLLSKEPYQKLNRNISWVKSISKDFDLRIFLSIRCFDQVLPGAYVTDLRFRPREAIIAKNKLLLELEKGVLPSWVGLVERLQNAFENVPIKIWTQEDYEYHSGDIVREFLGVNVENIPKIIPPLETKTPSFSAVVEVEKIISSTGKQPLNWTSLCDEIYTSMPCSNKLDKYTFLNGNMIADLRKKYDDDLNEIKRNWAGALVQFV